MRERAVWADRESCTAFPGNGTFFMRHSPDGRTDGGKEGQKDRERPELILLRRRRLRGLSVRCRVSLPSLSLSFSLPRSNKAQLKAEPDKADLALRLYFKVHFSKQKKTHIKKSKIIAESPCILS